MNGIVYISSEKDLSYFEISKIIYEYSDETKIVIKNIENHLKKPKQIIYDKKYKKIQLKRKI
jgi:hypothetical protein